MRVVIQRVSKASVTVDHNITGSIGQGYVILLGIEKEDTIIDSDWLCKKITALRVFADTDGKMNLSVTDIEGECLIISQFTLHAGTKKGNRPSFIKAARPDQAIPLYEAFVSRMQDALTKPVQTGKFGADMQVSLINDGPVTIIIDSKTRE
ncbi:MAG: D-tyrosyl-tRNA(Tyr) deacylase [Bacteroidetes bacterium]|nr:MAG: D-tyrosyl-tRNA(Tyr) deacylase [Bacteroidota bacterium]